MVVYLFHRPTYALVKLKYLLANSLPACESAEIPDRRAVKLTGAAAFDAK